MTALSRSVPLQSTILILIHAGGVLQIRTLHAGTWRRVCLYSTGGAVRTLVWHPSEVATIFSGSANGALYKITVVIGGVSSCTSL